MASATWATTGPAAVASDGVRDTAARVWRHRHRIELEAARRFDALAARLATQRASAAVVRMAQEAAADERRHADLCTELVCRYGGAPPEATSAGVASIAPRGLDEREALLYEVVALCCVTESLSAALLLTMVEQATDRFAGDAMRSILRDEVQHARIGWAHLAAEHQLGARDVVGPHLPAILATTVNEELFSLRPEHENQDELGGLGSLSRQDAARIFTETMQAVVFPGLQRFGVDISSGERWMSDRLE